MEHAATKLTCTVQHAAQGLSGIGCAGQAVNAKKHDLLQPLPGGAPPCAAGQAA